MISISSYRKLRNNSNNNNNNNIMIYPILKIINLYSNNYKMLKELKLLNLDWLLQTDWVEMLKNLMFPIKL